MKASKRRLERNKDRIIQATLELFKIHGIKKTTTNDVARNAGVSPATVFNHFGDKNSLVHAAVEYFIDEIMTDFKKIFQGGGSFTEKFQQILTYKMEMIGRFQGDFIKTLVSEDPQIRNLINSVFMAETKKLLTDFYNEGKQQGYIDPDLDNEAIIRYFLIVRSGMAAESIFSEDSAQNIKIMQELMPLFLYGLMGQARPEGNK
jgi:TetR/AcrR family transcriptional regulator, cholesterol catabolism regulator